MIKTLFLTNRKFKQLKKRGYIWMVCNKEYYNIRVKKSGIEGKIEKLEKKLRELKKENK